MFTSTKVFIISAISLALVLLFTLVSALPNHSDPVAGPYGATEYKRNVTSAAHSCGGIFLTEDPYYKFYGVIPEKFRDIDLNDVPTQYVQIPTYGFMVPEKTDPAKVKFYDKSFDNVFPMPVIYRMLWDGYDIIWYDPILTPDSELEPLRKYVDELNTPNPTTVALPFLLPDRNIPFNKKYAFSTWGASQSCMEMTIEIWEQFQNFTDATAPDHSGEPPVAPLSHEGLFYAPYLETQ